ncbi:MAG: MFS transporter [Chloroflexi bacterium]|nr:MFS transporter [Chloroflexota bacterium]
MQRTANQGPGIFARLPVHYAWIVTGITCLVLLAAAGVRAAPSVLIKPLETEFGWSRSSISFAVAVSILWFGLGGPIAGTLVDRFGPRRIMAFGLVLIAAGTFDTLTISELWQFHLFWGLIVGVGTGALANVLGAAISQRWFRKHRGLVVGLFGAASAAGQLIFLPTLMNMTATSGWRSALTFVAVFVAALLVPLIVFMRNRPEDVGLRAVGDDGAHVEGGEMAQRTPLREALRTRDFAHGRRERGRVHRRRTARCAGRLHGGVHVCRTARADCGRLLIQHSARPQVAGRPRLIHNHHN